MSDIKIIVNGRTSVFESGRPLSGGVNHSDFATIIRDLANCAAPNVVTVNCAANGTVNLNSVYNTIRTTSDGTIANAVFNLPTSPTDGELCVFVTTGAVSNCTGTVSNSSVCIPAINSTAAGTRLIRRYDTKSGLWLAA